VSHRDADHRFTGLWQQLIFLAQPSVAIEPPQRPLDNPSLGAHLKALGVGGPLDNFQAYASPHPQRLNSGYHLARTLALQNPEQACGSITVLHTGRGDDDSQHQPEGLDQEVALAPLDVLLRIVPSAPPVTVVLTA
jgi:hypothetical protein